MRAVVVGASSGLGRCIGVGLAQKGEQVDCLTASTRQARGRGRRGRERRIAVRCDVTDATSAHEAIEEAAAKLGGIDALVYSTGIGPLASASRTSTSTRGAPRSTPT